MELTTIIIGIAIALIALKLLKTIGKAVFTVLMVIAVVLIANGLFGLDLIAMLMNTISSINI